MLVPLKMCLQLTNCADLIHCKIKTGGKKVLSHSLLFSLSFSLSLQLPQATGDVFRGRGGDDVCVNARTCMKGIYEGSEPG